MCRTSHWNLQSSPLVAGGERSGSGCTIEAAIGAEEALARPRPEFVVDGLRMHQYSSSTQPPPRRSGCFVAL